MSLNDGYNKNNTNSNLNKKSLIKRVQNLSKTNAEKKKQFSKRTTVKNRNFPINSGNYWEKNYNLNNYFNQPKDKSKLFSSVNTMFTHDGIYNFENKPEQKKVKTELKKTSHWTNDKTSKINRDKEIEKKLKNEKLENERQRLMIEEQKEKERKEKEKKEKEKLEKRRKEKARKEKERIERIDKEIEEYILKGKERSENERKEKVKKEREETERKEKEKRQKELLEKEKEMERLRILEEEKKRIEKEKKGIEEKEKKEKEEKEKARKDKEKEEKEKELKRQKEEKEKEKLEQKKKEKEREKLNEYNNKELISTSKSEINEENNLPSEISSVTKSKIGLRNLGNTCFMNTCLQNLIHSDYFILKLFSKSSLISSRTKISKQFYSLCQEVSSCSSSACSPYDFKSAFGSKHSMFSGYAQHDTQEFCRILLEDMNYELNEVIHPAPYKELSTLNKTKIECDKEFDEVFRKRENSLIMDVFYGQLINIFKCDCNFETYSFEKILDLPLLLPKGRASIDIKDLLKVYFECERIKFETKCENCKKKEWHTKQIKISQPPNILILSLQRQNPRTGTKNNSYVDFSDELDMSIYLDHECWNKNDAKYSLYGIGNHSGSIDFGHYYAYIKINNSWYEFNDSHVSSYYKRENNSSSNAYILFYKKNNI